MHNMCQLNSEMKWKAKHTTLSEPFQNALPNLQKTGKVDISNTQIHDHPFLGKNMSYNFNHIINDNLLHKTQTIYWAENK